MDIESVQNIVVWVRRWEEKFHLLPPTNNVMNTKVAVLVGLLYAGFVFFVNLGDWFLLSLPILPWLVPPLLSGDVC